MSSRRIIVIASEVLGMARAGGAGTADSLLAVALGRHGHQVELLVAPGRTVGQLTPEWTRNYADAGVSVRALAPETGVRPEFLAPTMAVLRALGAQPPDVVIVNDWRGLGYAALMTRHLGLGLSKTAFIIHCHGPARVLVEFAQKVPDTIGRFGEDVTERASIELADAVVSPSAWLLEWMRTHGWPVPSSAAVIQYIRQSVALEETPIRARAADAVRRLAFFGQLREGKGIRIFLAALNALEPHLLEGVEVVFLGRESARWTREQIASSLSSAVTQRLGTIRFETSLERTAALEELRRPGTLAVVPSLLDNSPNTVSECIEHGVPFVATETGGIPELVAEDDRDRVLCAPTTEGLTATLTRALMNRPGFAPARPARDPGESLAAWLELVESVSASAPSRSPAATRLAVVATSRESSLRARRLAQRTQSAVVEVVAADSRSAGLAETSAEWIVFLDDEDVPDEEILDRLVAAQAASNADAVTVGVRPADDSKELQLFLGNPGALGLVANHYGVVALVRRSLTVDQASLDGSVDPDWVLLARLALGGARIVSIPEPLSLQRGRPGSVGDVPGDGLAVLNAFEEKAGIPASDLPQLAATLAASYARLQRTQSGPTIARRRLLERGFDVLRNEGVSGLARRARTRIRVTPDTDLRGPQGKPQ